MAENWYMILELAFDPDPIHDINIINQRIDEKSKFWSSNFNDFSKGPRYRKYHQMIPEIRKIMADEEERKRQIEEACRLTYGPIDHLLKMIGRKGMITEEEIKKLSIKQKADTGIIRKRAAALGIKLEAGGIDYQAIYDKYYKAKPQNAAVYDGAKQLLGSFNVANLYEFLYMDSDNKMESPPHLRSAENAHNLSCNILCRQASDLKRNKYYKNDSVSGSGSKLCGQCELTFKDNNSKALYDNYLMYNKRKEVLDQVREIFDISDELQPEQIHRVLEQLTEIFRSYKLAEQVLTAFCKVEKIPMPIQSGDNRAVVRSANIKVCRCGCTNDVSGGRTVCRNCGLDLIIKCPKCGEYNEANIKVCKCGFPFENIDKAIALCDIAQTALDGVDYQVARIHLQDASAYWPGSQRVAALGQRLATIEGRIGNLPELMRKACESKAYYEARRCYEAIKKFFPAYMVKDLEEEMHSALEKAQLNVRKARQSEEEGTIIQCAAVAYEACRDYPGVKEMLSKYPPQSAYELKISVDAIAKTNVLSWNKSRTKDPLYYTVVKKIGAVPANSLDGTLVGRVSMCSVTDHSIIPGEYYYYSIFTERAGVYSLPLVSKNPVVNLFEISGVTIAASDGTLQLSWDEVTSGAKVKIYRVNANGTEENLYCSNNQGFIDRDLVNDQSYTYRVCLVYQILGRSESTEGIVITGIPTKPPKAVEHMSIKPVKKDWYQITWEHTEGSDVRFYYSTAKPQYQYGDFVSQADIDARCQNLIVTSGGLGTGTFQYAGEEVIYVMAAVMKSDSAVIGAVVRVNKEEPVSIHTVTLANDKIHISVDAEKGAVGFVVLYRFDQYAADISDMNAARKYIPLKQYRHDGLLIIDSVEARTYYFSVFAEFIRDGEKEYSSGSDYLFSNRKKEVITYSIHVTKRLFGERSVILAFESEYEEFQLPDIDIVAAVGAAPMFQESAASFCSIPSQPVSGSVRVKIPLSKELVRDTYIKAFLKNESLQNCYQLKLRLKSSYKIS